MQEAASKCLEYCDASQASMGVECDGAQATWLDDGTALVALRSGQLLAAAVRRKGGATELRVVRAGAAPPPSAVAALSGDLVFIGSLAGDSLLVRATPADAATVTPGGGATTVGDGNVTMQGPAKRMRLESADADRAARDTGPEAPTVKTEDGGAVVGSQGAAEGEGKAEEEEESDDEALMYGVDDDAGPDAGRLGASSLRFKLSVLDSLVGLGPLRDLALCEGDPGGQQAQQGQQGQYLVGCCGQARGGALAVLRRKVAPDVVTEVPLPGGRGWLLLFYFSFSSFEMAGSIARVAADILFDIQQT
jgi:hypothetical protein